MCIYDATLEGWQTSKGWANDPKSTTIVSAKWLMTKLAILYAIILLWLCILSPAGKQKRSWDVLEETLLCVSGKDKLWICVIVLWHVSFAFCIQDEQTCSHSYVDLRSLKLNQLSFLVGKWNWLLHRKQGFNVVKCYTVYELPHQSAVAPTRASSSSQRGCSTSSPGDLWVHLDNPYNPGFTSQEKCGNCELSRGLRRGRRADKFSSRQIQMNYYQVRWSPSHFSQRGINEDIQTFFICHTGLTDHIIHLAFSSRGSIKHLELQSYLLNHASHFFSFIGTLTIIFA